MKKLLMFVFIASLIPAAAFAGVYDNPFCTIEYPSGWALQDMKMPSSGQMVGQAAGNSAASRFGNIRVTNPQGFLSGSNIADQAVDAAIGTAQDTAVAGVAAGAMEGLKKSMPKFASATLKRQNPYGEIMITMVEGMSAGDMSGAGAGAGGGSGGEGQSNCKQVEGSKSVSWGGKSAKSMTMVCKSGDEWNWISTTMMSRQGANYVMVANFTSKSDNPEEFNTYMRSAINSVLSGTRFK